MLLWCPGQLRVKNMLEHGAYQALEDATGSSHRPGGGMGGRRGAEAQLDCNLDGLHKMVRNEVMNLPSPSRLAATWMGSTKW